MGKRRKVRKGKIFMSMIVDPFFIVVYGYAWYNLYLLCKFGRNDRVIFKLFFCLVFFFGWVLVFISKVVRKSKEVLAYNHENCEVEGSCVNVSESGNIHGKSGEKKSSKYKRIWTYIAIVILASTTVFYGVRIYESAINYNGSLSWFLEDLFNKKTVKFTHNNIYEDGIEGIFSDIDNKIDMPQELYVSDNFIIKFKEDGRVASFDGFLYGKNSKGKTESFLITYNEGKSEKITVYLNGYCSGDYSEDNKFEPFLETMKVAHIKDDISKWNGEDQYGILYCGKRSWGYNTDGIIYIDTEGNISKTSIASNEIIGYTVSVYVPEKEDIYTPVRYNLVNDLNNIYEDEYSKQNHENSNVEELDENVAEKFFLSDKVGYHLVITGSALGSRFYSLYGTFDGTETWTVVNEDPFNGSSGGASGMTFIDHNMGFLCLAHNGGDSADLYMTKDGGKSYEVIEFPEHKVTLSNGESYNPYDFPDMPYKEGENLYVLVGQGADGDYNGGCKALYQSEDNGQTWKYIRDVK